MARKRTDTADPYAPPPMYHDRSGAVLRVGLMAVLLAAIGIGYFAWSASTPPQTATAPLAQQQQLADAGYRAQPEQIPQAQPAAPTPQTASPAPAPQRRAAPTRSSRSESAEPVESTPPPVSNVPTTPAPIPPLSATPQTPDSTPPTQG
jgi:hypothetical protein